MLYASFNELACDSNGSFCAASSFCQRSPTNFAISVNDRCSPLTSSRTLFEKRTYAEGDFSGAFSSAFGCRRYFRFVSVGAVLVASLEPDWGCRPSVCLAGSEGPSPAGEPSTRS